MRYLEVKPDSPLSEYIKCFWFLEKDYSIFHEPMELVFPDGCIDLVFQFGSTLHTLSNNKTVWQPVGFLIGQLKQPLSLISSGLTRVIGVRFYAYGAYPFLRLPLKELTGQTTALDALVGNITHELADKLSTSEPQEAFRELERFLLGELLTNKRDIAQIKAVTNFIYQQHGVIEIESLANFANMTRRSLERQFAEIVGFSPKSLARIVRFNKLRTNLMFDPKLNLTDLAYRYNYFDQAHFIHDFEQFTGQTPSAFAEKVAAHQIYFYK